MVMLGEYDGPRIIAEAQIPAPLKWGAAIIASLFAAGTAAMAFWLVTSVSEMQVTLARLDERMAGKVEQQEQKVFDLDRRVTRLEGYHTEGSE